MTEPVETRPELEAVASGEELHRWYWLRSELVALARSLGVSTSGAKLELLERLARHLDGDDPQPGPPGAIRIDELPEHLALDTVLPEGQRCTQRLRAFFVGQVGPAFRFDAAMRTYVGSEPGRTLRDAVEHWHATRSEPRAAPAGQFERNRFSRAWHREHPTGTHDQMLRAWAVHRSLPREQQPEEAG